MITLQEIDKSSYMGCICLKVKDEQRDFVADNIRSLAETRLEKGLYTRAVCPGGVMAGSVLFDYDPELPGWCMSRFMIGAQYQGRGLGEEAVLHSLGFMREHMGMQELYLHVELENTAAHETYQKLGFRVVRETQYTFDGVVYRERRVKICF